ncbi:MAG: 23S rRNA (uracil(1939)-C(5))-methyltransferase RlmD [Clostridia bacterium]|nr:23S rRNA (uracil(1939)-C(5))-methyltransferase RlmD [Clostridia bacterium]
MAFLCDFADRHCISAYDEETGKGLLRHIYLRIGAKTGEIMVCLVLTADRLPSEEKLIREVQEKFSQVKSLMVNVNAKNTNVVLGDRYRLLWGREWIEDVLCGLKFRITPQSFYQVNHDACELLYGLAKERANLSGNELLLDLYCGIGSIGLSMADKAGEVLGMEIVERAAESATENAERNGIRNAAFFCGDASDPQGLLKRAAEEKGSLSNAVVVLDPPRKGTTAELIEGIASHHVPRVVYVSCNPDTLARDCAIFKKFGYEIGKVTPVDLFPRTGHVESVCLLSKLNARKHIEIDLDMDELDLTAAEKKATYQEIKNYVMEHSGMKVSSLYIAQVKQKCGIIERENYNKAKNEDNRQPQCPPEKELAIKDALKHFGMI